MTGQRTALPAAAQQPAPLAAALAAGPEAADLVATLAESRARWRDFALLGADLSFEIDAAGCFVLLGPEEAFGWTSTSLLGVPAESLLIRAFAVDGFNPFLPPGPVRRHRAWIRRADGRAANVLISALPLRGADGSLVGARGTIQDVTDQDRRDDRLAQSLLQHRTVREIARRMRRAVLPDMVIKIGLEELLDATGASGVAVLACDGATPGGDVLPPELAAQPTPGHSSGSQGLGGQGLGSQASLSQATPGQAQPASARAGVPGGSGRQLPRVLHRAGEAPPCSDPELLAYVCRAASATVSPWSRVDSQFDRRVILTGIATHFCDPVVLMLWRDERSPWLSGDTELCAAFLATLGGVLEHDQVQRELARQSGADTLTGLLNRESFTTEVGRRLDRLDSEGLAATLMVIGLDRFQEINHAHGHESGDEALRQAAHVLREAVRPTDLVARFGGDIFAIWLDGADQFAAAERAEMLCQKGVPVTLVETIQLRVSVGLTTRPSRSYESIDTLLEQAQAALSAIKLAGGGRWHFYNEGIGA